MSNAATRQAIADALSTVAGIHGYPSKPDSVSEGDGWPQWRGQTPRAGTFEVTWAVLIVLPSTWESADAFADEIAVPLVDALHTRDVMYVDSLAPAKIETEAGDMFGLLLTGRST